MGILNQIIIDLSKVNIEYNLHGVNYKLDGPGLLFRPRVIESDGPV